MIYFSDVFGVEPEVVDTYGAFNIALVNASIAAYCLGSNYYRQFASASPSSGRRNASVKDAPKRQPDSDSPH
jgi:hypothetical protein